MFCEEIFNNLLMSTYAITLRPIKTLAKNCIPSLFGQNFKFFILNKRLGHIKIAN